MQKPLFINSSHIMLLEGYSSYQGAYDRIKLLNSKLSIINKKILNCSRISIDSYIFLYEIPIDYVYKALDGKHKLILKRKDINKIEGKSSRNQENFNVAKSNFNKIIIPNRISLFDYAIYYDINIENLIEIIKSI